MHLFNKATYIFIVFIVFITLLSGCIKSEPHLIVEKEIFVGQPLNLKAIGLKPDEIYSIALKKSDVFQRKWRSQASFKADLAGEINISTASPVSGSYIGSDCYGLLWSMEMQPVSKEWQAPMPNDFEEINIYLTFRNDTLDYNKTKQWIISPKLNREIINNELQAEIFSMNNQSNKNPALMILGGSGGGLSWARKQAAYFSRQGFTAMALAYFNSGDLPKHLAQLPLEYIDNALDFLSQKDNVDNNAIGIIGYSKGAELALLVASQKPAVKCVVAIAPGSAVFQGFKPPKYPVISSWTKNGEDLAFVPNAYDTKFFETFDGMYLWYQTLLQYEAFSKAAIHVENIKGNILFISGVKDKIWPATYMAEQMIARLHINDFAYSYEHLAFPNAGHGIAEPPGVPTINVSNRLGGTPIGNANARKEGWRKIMTFLNESLK